MTTLDDGDIARITQVVQAHAVDPAELVRALAGPVAEHLKASAEQERRADDDAPAGKTDTVIK